ncbi:MAG: hypothetical protein ACFFBD_20470, partial [Candidatus Hodarchaeota archaeon]
KLLVAFEYHSDPCCLATPTLGDAYWRQKDKAVDVLDIDTRFAYLPKYRYYDIRFPYYYNTEINLLVVDPPYFRVTIDELYGCIIELTQGNFKTKLVIGYLKRFEREFLQKFAPFNLKPTKFPLEYQTLRPNKWRNCRLYSNYDFKGIKTLDYQQRYKKKEKEPQKTEIKRKPKPRASNRYKKPRKQQGKRKRNPRSSTQFKKSRKR